MNCALNLLHNPSYLKARNSVRGQDDFAIVARADLLEDVIVGLNVDRLQLEVANLVNCQLLFAVATGATAEGGVTCGRHS